MPESDHQLLRVAWWYGAFDDAGAGEWYFEIPGDWDEIRFRKEIEIRIKHHLRTQGWEHSYDLNWGDLVNEVDLGPHIELLHRPIADITITVNHDEGLLPMGWEQESCPDCFATGNRHQKIGELDYQEVEPREDCPSCGGTGWTPEDEEE